MVEAKAGSGKWLSPTRERVDFGRTIGKYLDEDTGESSDTSIRIIHYAQGDIHVVPSEP